MVIDFPPFTLDEERHQLLEHGTEVKLSLKEERNAGDDRARAATLYAEAASNYEAIGLVPYASRLAEKRVRLNLA